MEIRILEVKQEVPREQTRSEIDILFDNFKKAKIFIGDNSWIGTGAVIMPGILIGKDCIIGSNAVVTKDVNDFEIVAGIPAKVIGKTN